MYKCVYKCAPCRWPRLAGSRQDDPGRWRRDDADQRTQHWRGGDRGAGVSGRLALAPAVDQLLHTSTVVTVETNKLAI